VSTTTPANSAAGVTTNANVTVTFSEPVNVTGTWFSIVCATSGTHDPSNSVVSGGPATFTIDPTDFVQGETCNATVFAAQVSDQDANDPLDNPAANYVFSFAIDAAPSVTVTTPANNAFAQPDTNVTIVFNEAVNVTGAWFNLACGTTGARTPSNAVVTTSDNITFTINPNVDFAVGETCNATVFAALVSDQDGNDPPDNMTGDVLFTFGFDAPPAVTSHTPTLLAPNVATDINVVVDFSEAVTLTPGWLSVTCGATTITDADGLVTGGPNSYTFNPTTDLPVASNCSATIFAAQVSDNDGNDPPDAMTANYVWTFTTDAPPSVSSTTPGNGAIDQTSNTNVTVNFSENVAVAGNWFSIVCGSSGTHDTTNSLVAGDGTAVLSIDPTDFSAGETCNGTVFAAQISDTDANDPPNLMVANYGFSFSIDAAPAVTNVTPLDTAANVATNTDLTINFSEPVAITNASLTISCANTGAHVVTVSGGPVSWTVNPTVDFGEGELCTVTVLAAQVADNDANDPPNNMLADFPFSFTTDVSPSVTATTPTSGGGGGPSANVSITFSEPVNVTGSWFGISCTTSGIHTAVVSGGPTTFTLNPDVDFTAGESCTVTVFAAQVDDQDAGDPPANMVVDYAFSFTVDAAPTVTSTTPFNGAGNQTTTTNVVVNFSEPVNVSGTSFTINCASSGAHAFVAPATPASSFTLDPTADFAQGELCTVTVVAAQVTDVDGFDPPENMDADYVFSFTIDAAPSVTSTTPADGATDQSADDVITINFSEAVNFTDASFQLSCGGVVSFTSTGSGTTQATLTPAADLPSGQNCVVIVGALGIADVDAFDPPETMLVDYMFDFDVDAAPSVTATSPADTATQIGVNANVVLDFSEAVTVDGTSFTLACGVAQPFVVTGSGTAQITLDPDTSLPENTLCSVQVVAANVTDVDTNDTPDVMAANYNFSFTTDAPPTVVNTTPANNATGADSAADITVVFSEAVNVTAASFTVTCGVAQTFAVTGSGTDTITINPDNTLPSGIPCTVNVVAANVSDSDAGDPPDLMVADYPFTFETDQAPAVTTTVPADDAASVATNANIVINFSEAVNVVHHQLLGSAGVRPQRIDHDPDHAQPDLGPARGDQLRGDSGGCKRRGLGRLRPTELHGHELRLRLHDGRSTGRHHDYTGYGRGQRDHGQQHRRQLHRKRRRERELVHDQLRRRSGVRRERQRHQLDHSQSDGGSPRRNAVHGGRGRCTSRRLRPLRSTQQRRRLVVHLHDRCASGGHHDHSCEPGSQHRYDGEHRRQLHRKRGCQHELLHPDLRWSSDVHRIRQWHEPDHDRSDESSA
jgi:methionine-rich copper-binding protein CopC